MIDIYYYMVLFISYPFSALGHDISPRVDRLDDISMRSDKGYAMKNDVLLSIYHILQHKK